MYREIIQYGLGAARSSFINLFPCFYTLNSQETKLPLNWLLSTVDKPALESVVQSARLTGREKCDWSVIFHVYGLRTKLDTKSKGRPC